MEGERRDIVPRREIRSSVCFRARRRFHRSALHAQLDELAHTGREDGSDYAQAVQLHA